MSTKRCDPIFGTVIKQRRLDLGLRQQDLSDRCGWKHNLKDISEIEHGKHNPQFSTAEKLLKALEWTWIEYGIAVQLIQQSKSHSGSWPSEGHVSSHAGNVS